MGSPWQNKTSPGFVYFSTPNVQETNDFLAFSDQTSSPHQKFSPSNCSSPQKFQRSPRNFNNRHNYKNRYSGGNFSRSNNSPNNNSFGRKRDNQPFKRNYDGNNGQRDIWKFFEPTCLKDPWEALEKAQALKIQEQNKPQDNEAEDSALNEEDSTSGSDSEETSENEQDT